jgi:hypothetical protein
MLVDELTIQQMSEVSRFANWSKWELAQIMFGLEVQRDIG